MRWVKNAMLPEVLVIVNYKGHTINFKLQSDDNFTKQTSFLNTKNSFWNSKFKVQ